MNSFHVWIVTAFDTFVLNLVGTLVTHGWTVRPLTVDNNVCHYPKNSEFGVLVGLYITKDDNVDRNPSSVSEEVHAILQSLSITYITVIVCQVPIAGAAYVMGTFPVKDDVSSDKIIH
jgi:hypothetical protein